MYMLKLIARYYRKTKYYALLLFLGFPLMALCEQFVNWYLSDMINVINTSVSLDKSWNELLELLKLIAALVFAQYILSFVLSMVLQNKVSQPVRMEFKYNLFDMILGQHKNFWQKYGAGLIFNKIESNSQNFAAYFSLYNIFSVLIYTMTTLAVMLCLLMKIYIPLALVYVVASVILLIIFHKLSNRTLKSVNQQENLRNRLFGHIVNLISNYFSIKIFSAVNRETEALGEKYDIVCKSIRKSEKFDMVNQTVIDLSLIVCECGIIMYLIILMANGIINIGNVVYALNAVMSFGQIFNSLIRSMTTIKYRCSKIQNNMKVLEEDIEIKDIVNAKKLKILNGEIKIKNLNFSFGNQQIFENFCLTVKPLEKVGIVGISGGGKSTLLQIIQRMVNVGENMVFIDGQDITKVSQESLHESIAFMPQNTQLFHRSLKENICYGKFQTSDLKAQEIAKKAYVDEFAQMLPDKYKTIVGDKGFKLSGGQRQRVGIARAILQSSKILLLDEATSALDSKSEKYIQKSLEKIIQNKTVIAVAHRLSTLKNMDRIIVIENGKIIEDGTPQSLLKNKGKYAKLWDLQA